jgi:hypothetical protein
MNSSSLPLIASQSPRSRWRPLPALLIAALLAGATPGVADEKEVVIVPPGAKFHGKTYGEWSAAFWQYALAQPLEGHLFLDTPEYDFSSGQKGDVWYVGAPDGPLTREVFLPSGKALLLTIRDVEVSSLEAPPFYGATEAEQCAMANWFADHIVEVYCEINGVPVPNLWDYRASSPQFEFTAPSPWIWGETGGTATSVSDGYFVMVELPKGRHTIHYGGTYHFAAGELSDEAFDLPHDVTMVITVGN